VIDLRDDAGDPDIDLRRLKSTARKLLRSAGKPAGELSLLLTGDAQVRELNRTHRGKDEATDVLSFPSLRQGQRQAGPDAFLGDIAISVDTARRQAAQYDATLQNEVNRLLIHGLLHLLGHDHIEAAERAAMEAEERRLAGAISMPWPYD
jgi:probable rRNA maturation factor